MNTPQKKTSPVSAAQVHTLVDNLFSADLHAKTVHSLSDATLGVINAGALAIHAIGRGLAAAKGLTDKHAVKQVDRCIGNERVQVSELAPQWVLHCTAGMDEVVVNLDWTEFDADNHSMLVLSLQTAHGRSQALLWKTVLKSELRDQRNAHEDELLLRFRAIVPRQTRVTVVADRGFADQKLFAFLTDELGFDYIIRFRGVVHVTANDGARRPAKDWLGPSGRTRVLRDASVTADRCPVATVVLAHDRAMQEPWCLAASRRGAKAAEVKRLYGKRFSCEETFRDVKDLRFGMGMKWNRISAPERRDRLMLLATLAQALLTALGEAGERAGLDRLLKTNTVQHRTLSLYRQGLRWYELIPTMPAARLRLLIEAYEAVLMTHPALPVLVSAALRK